MEKVISRNVTYEYYLKSPYRLWINFFSEFNCADGVVYVGNLLRIKSLKKEDRGLYICKADNGVGTGGHRNVYLELEYAPVIIVPRPRLGQALQNDTTLECHIEAFPPPAIVWTKDDIQLTYNQQYAISHFAIGEECTESTLHVKKIEKSQYGDYVCTATNRLGHAEGRVNLFETEVTEL